MHVDVQLNPLRPLPTQVPPWKALPHIECADAMIGRIRNFLQAINRNHLRGRREFVTENEIPRVMAHRCIIEASIGKHIVQTIEAPHSPGHRSNHRAAQEAT
jgi:hypothetical protein